MKTIAQEGGFEGTPSDLLAKLTAMVNEKTAKERAWPKNATALGSKLRQLAPNVRKVGINVSFSAPTRRVRHRAVAIVASVAVPENIGEFGNEELEPGVAGWGACIATGNAVHHLGNADAYSSLAEKQNENKAGNAYQISLGYGSTQKITNAADDEPQLVNQEMGEREVF